LPAFQSRPRHGDNLLNRLTADLEVLSEFGILFLLPGSRPRRLKGTPVMEAGGLPSFCPLLLANRSKLRIASSDLLALPTQFG